MRRIARITQAVAFLVTAAFVLLALGLLATAGGRPRDALPELAVLGIAIIAFLLASKPYVDADAQDSATPVEVRLWDQQVELLARLADSIAERTAPYPGLKPIPRLSDPFQAAVPGEQRPVPRLTAGPDVRRARHRAQ